MFNVCFSECVCVQYIGQNAKIGLLNNNPFEIWTSKSWVFNFSVGIQIPTVISLSFINFDEIFNSIQFDFF